MNNLVVNHDAIMSLSIPDGWQEFPVPDQGFSLVTIREFRPAQSVNDDVSLCLVNRGLALDDEVAEDFVALLGKPPHVMTSDDLEQVEPIVEDAADPERFSIKDARTEHLNGRPALIVEGRWLRSQTGMLRIYVDIRGDGRFVQEVSFSAPAADYEQLIAQIKSCILTIAWKPNN